MQQKLPASSEAQDPVRRLLLRQGLGAGAGALMLAGCASAPSGRPRTPPRLPPSERACADRLGWGIDAATALRWHERGRRRMIASLLRPASGEGLPAPVQARLEAMSIVTMSPLARLQQIEQLRRSEDRQAANRRLDELHREAVDRTLLLALHSPHGVRERMTWFWSNHFSVAAAKSNLRALVGDHEQALRERALGRFEDLLQAATFQPAMLRYLDNESSAAGRLNENHARELLELHTLGVDGGYTQRDVQELARVLSGLGLSLAEPGQLPKMRPAQQPQHWRDGLTEFNPARHDDGDKTLLGRRIAGGRGREEIVEALRLLARHGTLLAAVGHDGVRTYTAPPLMPDRSDVARRQAELWGNPRRRISVARHMYALRLGEVLPHRDLDTLRGIEGSRVKTMYRLMADKHGIEWKGRHFDRADPEAADLPNQAINHAATAVQAAAAIAVQSLAALPPLGFIHEDSGQSFVLDVADLFRDTVTLQIAFTAARQAEKTDETIDRLVRREASRVFRKQQVIASMIDRIKQVLRMDELEAGDGAGDDRGA